MKRKLPLFLILILILLMSVTACNPHNNTVTQSICVNGDISEIDLNIALNQINESNFTYTDKDENTVNATGYKLSDILSKVTFLDSDSRLMITATDNTSALIDSATANLCYAVIINNEVHIKAPNHPPVVGIKDVKEITVIAKNDVKQGVKTVYTDKTEVLSYGNAKLKFFSQVGGENKKFDISAFKFVPETNKIKISDFTGNEKNIVYLNNFDIIKATDSAYISWENGMLKLNQNNISENIFGIVTDTDTLIYDAFFEMKKAIDNNEKVMFILPDGLSYQQVINFNDDLSLFKDNYKRAATVNPAISNVALATLVTGVSPAKTEIVKRGVATPAVPDIFEYALSKNKTAKYIEGDRNLIITSLPPVLTIPDENGLTDLGVFENAKKALGNNPDLLFVHFHGIDDINHLYSPESAKAKAKIIEIEGYVQNLISGFTGTVIIVPDHGHITTLDENNNKKGNHGIFETGDMYVPYYIIKQ